MRIALIHYHLQGGGVTRIIWNQLRALQGQGVKAIVLSGKDAPFSLSAPCMVVPGLLYEAFRPSLSPDDLAMQMKSVAQKALGGPVDIWHVHNHSLGKNFVLPPALGALARQGERLLLQLHDFAEDGRPGNYRNMLSSMADGNQETLCRFLYPQADHVHYAVLNSRDYGYMRHAGLDAEHLHLLPNPVDFAPSEQNEQCEDPPAREPLWLYPTRAIRRKNIGEFLFWAALSPPGARFATTSGPDNPAEWQRYRRWQDVAAKLRLPVVFGGTEQEDTSFVRLLRSATCVVVTSVAEGFGMAFLEPWLMGTPVCGRDLPEITDSFRQDGLRLPYTYERLEVPVAWLGLDTIRNAAMDGLRRNMAAYGRQPGADSEERMMAAWVQNGNVDFGRLNEEMQESVLHTLVRSPWKAAQLQPAALPLPDDPQTLAWNTENNCQIIRSFYNLEQYGANLSGIYKQMLQSQIDSHIGTLNGQALLDHFLAPERLALLRVD